MSVRFVCIFFVWFTACCFLFFISPYNNQFQPTRSNCFQFIALHGSFPFCVHCESFSTRTNFSGFNFLLTDMCTHNACIAVAFNSKIHARASQRFVPRKYYFYYLKMCRVMYAEPLQIPSLFSHTSTDTNCVQFEQEDVSSSSSYVSAHSLHSTHASSKLVWQIHSFIHLKWSNCTWTEFQNANSGSISIWTARRFVRFTMILIGHWI